MSKHRPKYPRCVIYACFQFLKRQRRLLLDVAVTFTGEHRSVVAMGTLPGHLVWRRGKGLRIQRASREGEHGHRLAHPYTLLLQCLLPAPDVRSVIALSENQVCLHPGNASASVNQQFRDTIGTDAAVLVEVLAAFMRNGFHAAFHRNAGCAAQQVESFFVPEINARLEPDLYWTFSNSFQQSAHVFADPKNFINEINVLDAARN